MAAMPFYLAIDAGGTKTRCVIADSTRILGRASTGTVKLMRVSDHEATTRLQSMLEDAAASARVSLNHITRTCIGIAGITDPAVQAWARKTIAAKVSGDLDLCGDVDIALDAGFAGGPGILVISGTGANAIGRAPSGELHGAGGWGPVLGDEGSGFWIGLEAIRGALRAQDRIDLGETSTCLLREIEQHWKLNSLGELVALANQRAASESSPLPDFAALAPVVARCAQEGDVLAAGILSRAGEELAELVTLVFHKMTADPSNLEARTPNLEIAFTGSVLSHIAPVRDAMAARLAQTLPTARLQESAVDPLEGALWRARKS